MPEILRQHAETQYAEELLELAKVDHRQRPPNWKLSPWAVETYVLGGKLDNGFAISPKYIGSRRLVEIAIATLATDRALLLIGVPGTAKSWVSEHISAAISGDSAMIVQGTAGTSEEAIRYGWNYARLLAEGPSKQALVPSPVMRAMQEGKIARVEELTRIPADVQDALITILSEKSLPIPELNDEVQAVKGFNVIATANNRDRGVNELSSALKRRFNTVVLPLPETIDAEVEIVQQRVAGLGRALELPAVKPNSRLPAERSARLRLSRLLPAGWPWRHISATGCCALGMSLPELSAQWSRTPSRTASSGLNTWRRWSKSEMAGKTCIGRARMPSTNAVSIFGIRHHGPGSAYSLVRALDELRPDAILVEGPPDAQDLLPWAAHADLKPPVALLIYVPDQPKKAVFYPFAEFSPEWQAIRFGLANGTPVRFMDLPQAYQLAQAKSVEPAPVSEVALPAAKLKDPLTWLAESAGYSDGERWWEHMVEGYCSERGDIFGGILEMMSTLRAEVDQPEKSLFLPATPCEAQREAYMRQTIRSAQAEGFQKIAVVCGAWHAPVLAQMPGAAEDARVLKGLEKVKVSAAWVPWSYGRLSWESGYGAGIESPGWYEALWNAAQAGLSSSEMTIHWLTQVAHLLRGEDLTASSAHIIEAVRLAEALSALREQPVPGLVELNEAVRTVFCFGDDLPLRLIHEKLIVSERLGQVPEDAPMTPLQADLARQQKRLRLAPEAAQRDLDLDLRQPNDLERSYLLHRLDLLEIPWGAPQRVSGKSGTFHELWRVQWKPELAVKVVEASLWGNTVADAAAGYLQHELESSELDLPTLTRLIGRALLADLPAAVEALMARLDTEAALASDTGQLMDALPALADALRYGNVRQTEAAMIAKVVDGLVARICVGLPVSCASLDDDAASAMFARLNKTHSAVMLLQNEAYLASWKAVLQTLADQAGLHGLLAGRACAILLDLGVFDGEETGRRFGLALSTANEPEQAAAWVEGLLKERGALLIHEDTLWKVIDAWVAALPGETFITLLPLLRRTFSEFTQPERRNLGERAKQGSALAPQHVKDEADFSIQRAEVILPLLAQLLGVSYEERGDHE
jgi:hypothetical protein